MADNKQTANPDGKAFDDFFDSIGNKAEQLGSNKRQKTEGETVEPNAPEVDDDQRVVDEIESLCMNCHANVCLAVFPYAPENSR